MFFIANKQTNRFWLLIGFDTKILEMNKRNLFYRFFLSIEIINKNTKKKEEKKEKKIKHRRGYK